MTCHEIDLPDGSEEALDRLARALDAAEPLPTTALEIAYGAFSLHDLDDLLAVLVFDSSRADTVPVLRGAESEARLLTFRNDALTVDVTLAADGRTILGAVDPAGPLVLMIEDASSDPLEVPVDSYGRFRATTSGRRIRLRFPGYLVTPWISRLEE